MDYYKKQGRHKGTFLMHDNEQYSGECTQFSRYTGTQAHNLRTAPPFSSILFFFLYSGSYVAFREAIVC